MSLHGLTVVWGEQVKSLCTQPWEKLQTDATWRNSPLEEDKSSVQRCVHDPCFTGFTHGAPGGGRGVFLTDLSATAAAAVVSPPPSWEADSTRWWSSTHTRARAHTESSRRDPGLCVECSAPLLLLLLHRNYFHRASRSTKRRIRAPPPPPQRNDRADSS